MMNRIGELTAELLSSMNQYDLKRLDNIFSEDISLYYPGLPPMVGKKMSLIFLKKLFSNFEYLHFKQTGFIASNNQACVIWENEGRRKNSDIYSNMGVTLIEIMDDKIVLLSDYFKFEVPH
ncbi:nuclear transport factor 2 family protein [Photorhabdus noenieputensis]|uniref:nuclear transport factor 2 family protein n=1 Tax=Photorhabdus noenieputensis TaxID=1208607 RepID=UPI001FD04463|nr:nuclear transport factor 2 family protein [Photorhabdus noenieputensis]MCK3670827.1 nuclear transport factor 2 family protein [Photorhabdus noenieputensis]